MKRSLRREWLRCLGLVCLSLPAVTYAANEGTPELSRRVERAVVDMNELRLATLREAFRLLASSKGTTCESAPIEELRKLRARHETASKEALARFRDAEKALRDAGASTEAIDAAVTAACNRIEPLIDELRSANEEGIRRLWQLIGSCPGDRRLLQGFYADTKKGCVIE